MNRNNIKFINLVLIFILSFFMISCTRKVDTTEQKIAVVTTTNLIADIVKHVGKDFVTVHPLMGAGIDPHQYKASEGDVIRLAGADVIFHNGLHLEGKLGELLERTKGKVKTFAVSKNIPQNMLISTNHMHDPHIWFDPNLWIYVVNAVADGLVEIDPNNVLYYRKNEAVYVQQLLLLNEQLQEKLNKVPESKRILVTSHDAFSYFGKAFKWKVIGIQGINTASEASVYRIKNLARSIANQKISCIFPETSVSARSIEALIESVAAFGYVLRTGKPLYSDSLGSPDTGDDTYINMMNTNVDNIVSGILGENNE